MSYFDMISFEEASLLEGKQAETYKARKEREGLLDARRNEKRYYNRYLSNDQVYTGSKYTRRNPSYRKDFKDGIIGGDQEATNRWYDHLQSDSNRNLKALDMVDRNINKDEDISRIKYRQAKDAANRHIRRHPKTYKEAVELLEAYEPEYIDL